MVPLSKRVTAEALGTALLVAAVIGSGIMAERLSGGNLGIALLANTLATGAALVALILAFGPISGAHFNPAITFCDALERGLSWRFASAYIVAQALGGLAGAAAAHLMFGEAIYSLSTHARAGAAQVFSEFIATFGLMSVIWGCARLRSSNVAVAVGCYITAAYWFTASTSFANPAVTIARSLSNTFSGIRPVDSPAFIAAQFAGALASTLLFRWLVPALPAQALNVVVPHGQPAPAKKFLFACVHNAGRSQIAASLFNARAVAGKCQAISAGTQPADLVHPEVVVAMKEIGIDLSGARPQRLSGDLAKQCDVLVTMGCGETCPYIPGAKIIDWALPDPKGQSLESVRALRDDIHQRVCELMAAECNC